VPRPLDLVGEKRIENAMNVLAGDARASVDHFDFGPLVVGGGTYFEHAASGNSVASVHEQIKKDLLQLVGGAAHGGERLA